MVHHSLGKVPREEGYRIHVNEENRERMQKEVTAIFYCDMSMTYVNSVDLFSHLEPILLSKYKVKYCVL